MLQSQKDERVILVAPVGQDALAMAALLETGGFQTYVCQDMVECSREIRAGAGMLLVTEEALEAAHTSDLLVVLKAQATWSELPVTILTSGGESRVSTLLDLAVLAAGAVTLLERPITRRTLLRSVEVALQSRRRQYHARDLLAQLQSVNQTLEQRVAERTAEAVDQSEKLRILSKQLSAAEERERRRIAQILHDDLQQLLVAARVQFGLLRKSLGPTIGIDQIAAVLDRAFELTRSLSVELAPRTLEDHGLCAALQWLALETKKNHGVEVTVEPDALAEPDLADLRMFLFRSVRELLLNAVKHAPASPIRIATARCGTGRIRVTVTDQGPGFDPAVLDAEGTGAGGFGLFNLRQRVSSLGGEFVIETRAGQGTKVTVSAPCIFVPPPPSRPRLRTKNGRRPKPVARRKRNRS